MSALLHCILNGCWEEDSDDEDSNEHDTTRPPNHPGHMERFNSLLYYQAPNMNTSMATTPEEEFHQQSSQLQLQHTQHQQEEETFSYGARRNIGDLFQALGQGIHKFNQNHRGQFNPLSQSPTRSPTSCHEECDSLASGNTSSILVSARDFIERHTEKENQSGDEIIPSIQEKQFVMPGSALQKQMSLSLQSKGFGLLTNGDDECVICMEPFDETNPRMPTLCGCGENNTYFHLPCLYQWIEKDSNCPTCREKLRWEEF